MIHYLNIIFDNSIYFLFLIDISFNLGASRLRGFKNALRAMSEDNYRTASEEFYDSRWAKQVGNRAKRLCQMIRTGEYPPEFIV